uniref:Probable GTP-binding protein EngB n=1 Tax=Desulfatirhabdium butyrativorans TaxID=340467 RepID=A0A7C4MKB9_9BACT
MPRIVSARFEKSASRPEHYPPGDLPEIAFIGRSNVGKSSMINKLVNRRRLVKTSGKPGCTRLINFFTVNDSLRLVDLPGYGYAAVPDAERMRWKRMIETYLEKRSMLRGVVLIVDIRRDPDEKDLQMNAYLADRRIPALLALTKADKISASRRARQWARIESAFDRNNNEMVVFSAKTGLGVNDLWKRILSMTTALDPSFGGRRRADESVDAGGKSD